VNITRLAIENNRTTLVLLLAILLAGIQAFMSMPRAYDPSFVIRAAQVITYFPGASPERVEQLISDKLEKAIQEIPELDFVNSTSRTGISIIVVNIKESYTNMRPIWDNLRRKIDGVRNELPKGASDPVVNDEFGDVFGIVLGLTGEGFDYAELKEIADEARDELLRVPEAAKVEIYGAQEERIFVEYDNIRLTELGLSPSQLTEIISSRNIVNPGGSILLNNERIELEPSGNFESVVDIEHTIIQVPSSQIELFLKDIAVVKRGYIDPVESRVTASGIPALGIAISMREGGNNIKLGKQVDKVLLQLKTTYPIGIDFNALSFSPTEVTNKVDTFLKNLLQAIAAVTLIMLLSLGVRTGLVVTMLIPISIISAMLVMSLFTIGLDKVSLAALIISLGMLVDNGIVMSENIMVQMGEGKSSIEAAIDSANELRTPLLTSSLTTSAAFLPIYLADSAISEFTVALFTVVSITLLCSWILSMTVIPLLCVVFLKVERQSDYNNKFYTNYRRFLDVLLKNRLLTLTIAVLLFAFSLSLVKHIPNVFFPPSDRVYFKTELELPFGTAIERTETVAKELDAFIKNELLVNKQREGGITSWVTHIGSGGPRFILQHNPEPSSPNYALMVINTTSAAIIDELITKIDDYSFNRFPDLKVTSKRIQNGKAIKNPVEIRLYGKDADRLFLLADQLKEQLSSINGLRNISDDWGQRIKKLKVNINQARALRANVTSEDIAISLQTGLSGLELTQYRENDDVIPIVLRSVAADRKNIGKLEALSVYIQSSGISVPLRQVADIEVDWGAGKILRRNRLKTITVSAEISNKITAAEAFEDIIPWLDQEQQHWGIGYRYELGGDAESSQKANQAIMDKLPIAAFIILILLVGQFNSLRKPLIILVTIPLGITGVIFGLLVAKSTMGFMTLLGMISLAGIVINNAIVLLERIKMEREVHGLSVHDAIIEASQHRLRPIVLTVATTTVGLIPLYLGGGGIWEPMAVAIIAGLLFSTLMTLGVVPVLYSLLYPTDGKNERAL
jgi:multidrug efflux pump subunit AcrB